MNNYLTKLVQSYFPKELIMVDLMTPHQHHYSTQPPTDIAVQARLAQQPDNWLYEIRQKGQDTACYVMVQNAKVR